MRLTVVGCAAAWGSGRDAASSSYLVEHGRDAIVLDLGQGAFADLRTYRRPETLRAILVSHAHADHCVDLVPLRHYLRYEAAATPGTVALHGPAGLTQRFDALTGEAGFLGDFPFFPLEPGALELGELGLAVARVTHAADSFAFRVTAGGAAAGLVYSGDCGDAGDLGSLIQAGDTLLCEASFGAGPVPAGVPHLDARAAGAAARAGHAGRLVLTHIQPGYDEGAALASAAEAFGGPTLLARPGLDVTV